MVSLINKQLLLTAYAYLFIMEQQKAQQGGEALQLQVETTSQAEDPKRAGGTTPKPYIQLATKLGKKSQLGEPEKISTKETIKADVPNNIRLSISWTTEELKAKIALNTAIEWNKFKAGALKAFEGGQSKNKGSLTTAEVKGFWNGIDSLQKLEEKISKQEKTESHPATKWLQEYIGTRRIKLKVTQAPVVGTRRIKLKVKQAPVVAAPVAAPQQVVSVTQAPVVASHIRDGPFEQKTGKTIKGNEDDFKVWQRNGMQISKQKGGRGNNSNANSSTSKDNSGSAQATRDIKNIKSKPIPVDIKSTPKTGAPKTGAPKTGGTVRTLEQQLQEAKEQLRPPRKIKDKPIPVDIKSNIKSKPIPVVAKLSRQEELDACLANLKGVQDRSGGPIPVDHKAAQASTGPTSCTESMRNLAATVKAALEGKKKKKGEETDSDDPHSSWNESSESE